MSDLLEQVLKGSLLWQCVHLVLQFFSWWHIAPGHLRALSCKESPLCQFLQLVPTPCQISKPMQDVLAVNAYVSFSAAYRFDARLSLNALICKLNCCQMRSQCSESQLTRHARGQDVGPRIVNDRGDNQKSIAMHCTRAQGEILWPEWGHKPHCWWGEVPTCRSACRSELPTHILITWGIKRWSAAKGFRFLD